MRKNTSVSGYSALAAKYWRINGVCWARSGEGIRRKSRNGLVVYRAVVASRMPCHPSVTKPGCNRRAANFAIGCHNAETYSHRRRRGIDPRHGRVRAAQGGHGADGGRGRARGAARHRGHGAGPHPARLDAAGHERSGAGPAPAQGNAHRRGADHHAHRARRGDGSRQWARSRRRRLRRQAFLHVRTHRAYQGRAAPQPWRRRLGRHRARRIEDRRSCTSRVRRRGNGADRADRIPPAAFFHDPRRTRVHAHATARPRLGRQRLRRGAHGGRAHPPPAPDPAAVAAGRPDTDRARCRLPVLGHGRVMASRARRLAAQLRDLRDAAAAFPDALVLLDDAGRVRWINRAATRLLGLAWPNDRGVLLAERLQGSKLGDWLRSGEARADDIPAPADADIRVNASLIAFGHGQRVLRARDITELARLDQVRRDFVANVSHELRTPLTVIHGYLELLDPEEVPALAPVIAEMRTQSRRMGQIVEDLLTLSRLEMKRSLQDEHVATAPMFATIRKEAEALSQG